MANPYPANLRVIQLWQDRQQVVHNRRLAILRYIQQQRAAGRRPRGKWVSAWLTEEKIRQHSAYYTIMHVLEVGDVTAFI